MTTINWDRNCEGVDLKRPNNRSSGPALEPQTNNVRKIGTRAAIPAPNQCIRPVTTKYTAANRINQKPLRQRNDLRLSSAKFF